ncbi:HEXXH motif-containing putative peptide modification protein [Streptomyces sodiiphilus]|uniref:HEXXH motif-containing putative peptide modification protein n=1 Tax=Streptomyces sodiiphilus TaxID=226217 RepID=A0ABN2NSD6_9ACTN
MTAAPGVREIQGLGSTDADPGVLTLLAQRQRTRRLLLFRVLLDAVAAAPRSVLPPGAAAPARDHCALLEAADRAGAGRARRVLFYPLAGPWAEHCLRLLHHRPGEPPRPGGPDPVPAAVAHLGGVLAVAAPPAGLGFSTSVPVHGSRLVLPTLGALHCPVPDGTAVTLWSGGDTLVVSAPGLPAAGLRRDGHGGLTGDPRWRPLHRLTGGPRPVVLDDLDPGGTAGPAGLAPGARPGTVREPLDRAARERWRGAWREALPLLRRGGAARMAELALLDCIVPLTAPGGGAGAGAHASGTRAEAFGAVLSSLPVTPVLLAAGLVHELQHAKLAALGELLGLHRAGDEARYWAPWRPDPRPFDGLLHGAYAHLALADFWQRLAQECDDPLLCDQAWAAHARCRAQVGAVLPVLHGSRHLTAAGRTFVSAMAARHRELCGRPPPHGHLVRALAYVDTARTIWSRRYARGTVD